MYRIYDTANGSFVTDGLTEAEVDRIVEDLSLYEWENWTVEGEHETDSVSCEDWQRRKV